MPFGHGAGTREDAYAVLGIGRAATASDVRAAWRRAARETHPDVGGDAVAFRAARDAYETLIDPERRAAHDRLLDAREASRPEAATAHDAGTYRPAEDRTRTRARETWAGPGGTRAGMGDPSSRPAPPRFVTRVPVWALILVNVLTAIHARDVLLGFATRTPRSGFALFPLSTEVLELWTMFMNLLGLPGVFLVVAALSTAALVVEVVHGWYSEEPLLDGSRLVVARVLQMVAPAPIALALAPALVILIVQMAVQLLLGLLALAFVLAGMWLLVQLIG